MSHYYFFQQFFSIFFELKNWEITGRVFFQCKFNQFFFLFFKKNLQNFYVTKKKFIFLWGIDGVNLRLTQKMRFTSCIKTRGIQFKLWVSKHLIRIDIRITMSKIMPQDGDIRKMKRPKGPRMQHQSSPPYILGISLTQRLYPLYSTTLK